MLINPIATRTSGYMLVITREIIAILIWSIAHKDRRIQDFPAISDI